MSSLPRYFADEEMASSSNLIVVLFSPSPPRPLAPASPPRPSPPQVMNLLINSSEETQGNRGLLCPLLEMWEEAKAQNKARADLLAKGMDDSEEIMALEEGGTQVPHG